MRCELGGEGFIDEEDELFDDVTFGGVLESANLTQNLVSQSRPPLNKVSVQFSTTSDVADGISKDKTRRIASVGSKTSSGFHCYLLESLNPKSKQTYIGFTIDPKNRLRQHNGNIKNGALRTSRNRPWRMIIIVSGFTGHQQALQFEWAWQNPHKSRKLRNSSCLCSDVTKLDQPEATVNSFTSKQDIWRVQKRLHALRCLLNSPSWNLQPLSVRVCDSEVFQMLKAAPGPELPRDLQIFQTLNIDSKCKYAHWELENCPPICALCDKMIENYDKKSTALCTNSVHQNVLVRLPCCFQFVHILCLAKKMTITQTHMVIPCAKHNMKCVFCGNDSLRWSIAIQNEVKLGECGSSCVGYSFEENENGSRKKSRRDEYFA